MEDPWANAWGDSSKPSVPEPSLLWAAPSVGGFQADNKDDSESTPSWPKGSVANWGAEDLSVDHIWNLSSTSTSDEISLAGQNTPQESARTEAQDHSSSSLPLHEGAWGLPNTHVAPTLQSFSQSIPPEIINVSDVGSGSEDEEGGRSPQSPPSPISQPKSTPASLSEDADVFGSFETGKDDLDKESWTPTNSAPISSALSADWDSAWQAKSEHGNNEQEDEWEAARRQKEKRDCHVPPELLSSILRQFEELSKDVWEDLDPSGAEVDDNMDFEKLVLNSVLTRLSPDDMTLPPTVPFAKTFTSRHMSESLKLTRHCTSTRSSPMSMYLASKGSNSWEAAVKARHIVTSDDVTPVGWKIVDSSIQAESPVDDGRRKVGGIFSFFGRKTQNLSVDGNSKQSASPISPMTTSGVSPFKTSTPRAGSPATVEPSNTSERSQPVVSEPSSVSEVDKTILTTDAAKDELQPDDTQPSAVSRFIGRIVGRSKTRSMDSLALSADDLKFLADVPTSSGTNGATKEDLITILETPLPLASPSRRESPLPKLPPPPSRPTQIGGSDDLLSLFDPTPISKPPEYSLTMNPPPPSAMSTKAATSQSTISNASLPNRIWTRFEEPAIKSASSRHLSTESSASQPTTNEIKSDAFLVPKSSGSSSIPVLALPISALPLKSVQADDEFSDFLSSPAVHNSQHIPSPLNASMSVPSIKMTDTHDDDFGDFGEAVNDFPAPKPHPSGVRAPAVESIPSTQSETVHVRKKASRKADHSRTLSLLENAATRGRWLSPPSPIPEALSPPPDRSTSSSVTVGPDDHRLDMQTQQSLAMATYSSAAWRLPPPPSGTLLKPSVIPSTPVHSRLMPPSRPEFVAQPSRSPSSAQTGGLTAQDLSFFEGL